MFSSRNAVVATSVPRLCATMWSRSRPGTSTSTLIISRRWKVVNSPDSRS